MHITRDTFSSWQKELVDKRKGASHPKLATHSDQLKEKAIQALNDNPDYTPYELFHMYLDKQEYIGSVSYLYRLIRELKANSPRNFVNKSVAHNVNRNMLRATAPNQVWCWDITYLYKSTSGEYYYLYSVIDMYSRKIIHHEVHEKQSDTLAANFLKAAVHKENFEWEEVQGEKGKNLIKLKNKLILHSDNGAPMKGKNMLYQCYELGVQTHYSRPRQSNDNAYIESSFALLKHCHTMPIPKSFKTLEEARSWCEKFYTWYNEKHLHSGICYITPSECHAGQGPAIMERRNEFISTLKQGDCEVTAMQRLKFHKMPDEVTLMNFRAKRDKIASKIKNQEYQGKDVNHIDDAA